MTVINQKQNIFINQKQINIYSAENEFFFQDQDRLLVKRRNDNRSPGPVIQAYHVRL